MNISSQRPQNPQFGAMATKEEFKQIQQVARKHHINPNLIDYQKTEVLKHGWLSNLLLPRKVQDLFTALPLLKRSEKFNPQKPYFAVLETFSNSQKANEELKANTGLRPMQEGEDYTFQVSPKKLLNLFTDPRQTPDKPAIEGEWTSSLDEIHQASTELKEAINELVNPNEKTL